MRALRLQWSWAFSIVCEVALTCAFVGQKHAHSNLTTNSFQMGRIISVVQCKINLVPKLTHGMRNGFNAFLPSLMEESSNKYDI
jgi:hypothetical protein